MAAKSPKKKTSLADMNLPRILTILGGAHWTGTVILKERGAEHRIVLAGGVPTKLATPVAKPPLARVLGWIGLVDAEKLEPFRAAADSDETLARELLGAGVLDQAGLDAARSEQRARTFGALAKEVDIDAEVVMHEHVDWVADRAEAMPIDALRAVWHAARGWARRDGDLAADLERIRETPLALAQFIDADRFGFGTSERRVVASLAAEPKSVAALRKEDVASEARLVALVYTLIITRRAGDVGAYLDPVDLPAPDDKAEAPARPATSPLGRFAYPAFGLALLPLAWQLLHADDVQQRLIKTVETHPELASMFQRESLTMPELLHAIPGGRLVGAHLPYDTFAHWGYGLLAAVAFLGAITLLFDRGTARAKHLPLVGLFTATAGIAFLLLVQFVAEATQGVWVRGSGIVTLFFYIVKFIGFSYRSALDPENGFLISFIGFTCGVGFCEEATKAIPLVWAYRKNKRLDWRGAAMFGLASGVGFGVAEGIHYASDSYNGVQPLSTYVMRFVSCVALHAVWSAAVSIGVFERRAEFRARRHPLEHLLSLLKVVAIAMVLHGLYDTLLKKEYVGLAVGIALASFGYLAFVIERQRRADPAPLAALA